MKKSKSSAQLANYFYFSVLGRVVSVRRNVRDLANCPKLPMNVRSLLGDAVWKLSQAEQALENFHDDIITHHKEGMLYD